MLPRPHRIRRGRRSDFVDIMEVLAASNLPIPPADRATLRRFRHVVADLGNDLYIASIDERLVGVIHVNYARQITSHPLARIELLAVAPIARRQGVGSALIDHLVKRAGQRTCSRLSCDLSASPDQAAGVAFFSHLGWSITGPTCSLALTDPPA